MNIIAMNNIGHHAPCPAALSPQTTAATSQTAPFLIPGTTVPTDP